MREANAARGQSGCARCGESLSGSESFCPACGAAAQHLEIPRAVVATNMPSAWAATGPSPRPYSMRGNRLSIVAWGLVALLAVATLTVFFVKSRDLSRAKAEISARDRTIESLNGNIGQLQGQNTNLSSQNQSLTDSNSTLQGAAQACQDASQKTQDVLAGLNEFFNGQISYETELQLAQVANDAVNNCNSFFTTTVGG